MRIAKEKGFYVEILRSPENYLTEVLIPAHRKFVLPQKQFAKLILDSTKPTSELVELSLAYILNSS